jgi:hypothetical protein
VGCDLCNCDRQAACWTPLDECLLEARRPIEHTGITAFDGGLVSR